MLNCRMVDNYAVLFVLKTQDGTGTPSLYGYNRSYSSSYMRAGVTVCRWGACAILRYMAMSRRTRSSTGG
ncbi:hypothetical protein BMS3Bbin14_01188 [bacterium BMS3Bbin14]|nr:hypothetical protein BMS3Abin13_01048 [bacterium BMS3Abin13]GBE52713.1 hypothetical protein BMS3Bbin14_01188 [bacterium BMS3Bbin14]